MKRKNKLLSKTLLFLFVAFFMGNVQAYTVNFGSKMSNNGYQSFTPGDDYIYVTPLYAVISDDKQIYTKGTIYKTTAVPSNNTYISGTGVKFTADATGNQQYSDENTPFNITFDKDKDFVTFKDFFTIDGKSIDVKVTLVSLTSTVRSNEVRVYVNEKTTEANGGELIHRYLGFGTYNKDSLTQAPSYDFYDMLKIKIELLEAGTDTPYKNEKMLFYYNDIDGETKYHELAKFYDIDKDNIFLASSNSLLKINDDGIISSTRNETENDGWDKPKTQQVSLVVKGNSSLQTNGVIELGFGHSIDKTEFGYTVQTRYGETDVQFLVPTTKSYASDTPNGLNGIKVKKDDVIKYSITYRNTSDDKEKVKITDTISKGLKYKKNSAKMGSTALEPEVTENEDGTTTLVWEKELAAGNQEELTYSVDVIGGVSEVKNKAYLQYAKLKSGSTTEFDEYGEQIYLNELRNPLDIEVPNTGLNGSVYLIIIGMLFIVAGTFVIKKTVKSENK